MLLCIIGSICFFFFVFFFFFFFFFVALDGIVQCMVLGCKRTFTGNDVILPRLCCTDVIVHWIRTFSDGTDVFVLIVWLH